MIGVICDRIGHGGRNTGRNVNTWSIAVVGVWSIKRLSTSNVEGPPSGGLPTPPGGVPFRFLHQPGHQRLLCLLPLLLCTQREGRIPSLRQGDGQQRGQEGHCVLQAEAGASKSLF